MRFGLFGGARTKRAVGLADSQGYNSFIEYIQEAERLDFQSLFMVEHHFTGQGQVSASLTLLAYLAAKTSAHPPRHRRRGAALAQSGADRGTGGDPRPALQRPLRLRRRQGLPGAGVRRLLHPARGSGRALRRGDRGDPQGLDHARSRFSHHGKRWHYDNVVVEPAPMQQPHPPLLAGRRQRREHPARRAGGLQPAARPARLGRADHRARGDLPRRMRARRPRLRRPAWSPSPAPCR